MRAGINKHLNGEEVDLNKKEYDLTSPNQGYPIVLEIKINPTEFDLYVTEGASIGYNYKPYTTRNKDLELSTKNVIPWSNVLNVYTSYKTSQRKKANEDSDWININADKIKETEKAVLLDFTPNNFYSTAPNERYQKWFPKAVYREIKSGPFIVQQVKKWFISKENLWRIIGSQRKRASTKTYYHGTMNQRLPSIMSRGLLPAQEVGGGKSTIFLTPDLNVAIQHTLKRYEWLIGEDRYHRSEEWEDTHGGDINPNKELYPVILSIDIDDSDSGWESGPHAHAQGFFRYKDAISPDKIKVYMTWEKEVAAFLKKKAELYTIWEKDKNGKTIDEWTGIDEETKDSLVNLIHHHRKNKAVVFTTYMPEEKAASQRKRADENFFEVIPLDDMKKNIKFTSEGMFIKTDWEDWISKAGFEWVADDKFNIYISLNGHPYISRKTNINYGEAIAAGYCMFNFDTKNWKINLLSGTFGQSEEKDLIPLIKEKIFDYIESNTEYEEEKIANQRKRAQESREEVENADRIAKELFDEALDKFHKSSVENVYDFTEKFLKEKGYDINMGDHRSYPDILFRALYVKLMDTTTKENTQLDNDVDKKIFDIAYNWRNKRIGYDSSEQCYENEKLAEELKKQGIKGVKVITHGLFKTDRDGREGVRPRESQFSHCWIEVNGKILDITSDQFNKYMDKQLPKIYYGPKLPYYKADDYATVTKISMRKMSQSKRYDVTSFSNDINRYKDSLTSIKFEARRMAILKNILKKVSSGEKPIIIEGRAKSLLMTALSKYIEQEESRSSAYEEETRARKLYDMLRDLEPVDDELPEDEPLTLFSQRKRAEYSIEPKEAIDEFVKIYNGPIDKMKIYRDFIRYAMENNISLKGTLNVWDNDNNFMSKQERLNLAEYLFSVIQNKKTSQRKQAMGEYEFTKVKLYCGLWSDYLHDAETEGIKLQSPEEMINDILQEFNLDTSIPKKYWVSFLNSMKDEDNNIELTKHFGTASKRAVEEGYAPSRFRSFIEDKVNSEELPYYKVPKEDEKGHGVVLELEIPLDELYFLINGEKTDKLKTVQKLYDEYFANGTFAVTQTIPWEYVKKGYNVGRGSEESYESGAMLKIPLGENVETKKEEYWDPFSAYPEKLTNQHVLVVGKSGSGKTQSVATFIDDLWKAEVPSLIFDFQGEYADDRLTNADGKTFLECTAAEVLDASQGVDFNPLEVPTDPNTGDKQNFIKTVYQIASSLGSIFELGEIQVAILQSAISQSYTNKGFSTSDKSTWDQEPPTMLDVWEILRLMESKKKTESLKNLIFRINPLFETGVFLPPSDDKSSDRIFNQTTILNLSNLATKQLMLAVANFMLQKIYMDMLAKGPTKGFRLFVVIDEAHKLSFNETINELIREGRKYGIGLLLASQSVGDFDPIILNMAGTKVALELGWDDANVMVNNMGISEKTDAAKAKDLILYQQPFRALVTSNHFDPFVQIDMLPFFKKSDNSSKTSQRKKIDYHHDESKKRFLKSKIPCPECGELLQVVEEQTKKGILRPTGYYCEKCDKEFSPKLISKSQRRSQRANR